MQETSTNGAGARAAVEAAGGRAAPEGVPDPELVEQAKRRSRFTCSLNALTGRYPVD